MHIMSGPKDIDLPPDLSLRDLKAMLKSTSNELKFWTDVRSDPELPEVSIPIVDENIHFNVLMNKALCHEITSRPKSRVLCEKIGDYIRRFRWRSGLGISIVCCGVVCGGYWILCSNGVASTITSVAFIGGYLRMGAVVEDHQDIDNHDGGRVLLSGAPAGAGDLLPAQTVNQYIPWRQVNNGEGDCLLHSICQSIYRGRQLPDGCAARQRAIIIHFRDSVDIPLTRIAKMGDPDRVESRMGVPLGDSHLEMWALSMKCNVILYRIHTYYNEPSFYEGTHLKAMDIVHFVGHKDATKTYYFYLINIGGMGHFESMTNARKEHKDLMEEYQGDLEEADEPFYDITPSVPTERVKGARLNESVQKFARPSPPFAAQPPSVAAPPQDLLPPPHPSPPPAAPLLPPPGQHHYQGPPPSAAAQPVQFDAVPPNFQPLPYSPPPPPQSQIPAPPPQQQARYPARPPTRGPSKQQSKVDGQKADPSNGAVPPNPIVDPPPDSLEDQSKFWDFFAEHKVAIYCFLGAACFFGGSAIILLCGYFVLAHYNQASAETQNAMVEESTPPSTGVEVDDEKESAPPVADMV